MSARSKNKNARQDYEDAPSAGEGVGIRSPRLLMDFLRFLPIRTKRVIEGRSEGATP